MRKGTLLAALLLLAPAVSEAKTLEELLVEKGVITKGEAGGVSDAGSSKVYWNKGTRFEFPDTGFTTQINTQIQARYSFLNYDNDSGLDNTSSFEVNSAQLIVSGTALNNEFSYRLQSDFVGSTNDGSASPSLKDAYLQWNACDEQGGIRMGQFKTAISRQFNTSDYALQFADRSRVSDYFDLDRQQGAMGFASMMDGELYASLGIFNGSSDGEGINRPGVDTKETGVASVRWNPMGKMNPYQEGDVDWTEDAAVSIGAAYAYSDFSRNLNAGAGLEDFNANSVSVDGNVKWHGISFQTEIFSTSVNPDEGDNTNPVGFYAQGGYFWIPKKLELAARYGYVDCDDGTAYGELCSGYDNVNDITVGVNYYFWKHNLKAQLNYDFLNQDVTGAGGEDINTSRWLFQLSSYF